jgi:PAS domain S-box-containing protein
MTKKIMIVDDDNVNRYMLETLLKGYDFDVISAENGRDALDKARLDHPDLIISDILMPVMDGYALCREWKSDDALKHIPLVFYTATYTGSKNEEFALDLGAERFIIKPQEPEILVNILKEILAENYVVKEVAAKPIEEEMGFFRQYNEILFRKLEKKMSDLERTNQELRVLEERYRLIIENATDVIYTIDTDLNMISVSPSVEKILGYKPEYFINRPVTDLRDILTPESFEQAVANIGLILRGETISATAYKFIAKDGTIKFVEISGAPLIHEDRIIGITSVARDITERKQAEEALRDSENRFRALFENMSSCVAIYEAVDEGEDFIFRDFNRAGEYAERINKEDLIGRRVTEVFPGVQDFGIFAVFQRVWRTGNPEMFPAAFYKDNRIVGWRENYVLKLPSGEVVAVYDDITERKRAEEALQESEKKYRELYDFLPIPVYEMDLEAKIISANRAIYETFGGTEEDLKKGFNIWQALTPEEIEKSKKNIQQLLKGEQIRGTEYNLRRMDGSVFPAIVISSVIYSNDRPVGLRGAIIDITERRRQEEELRRLTVFLDSIVENIPDMIFVKDARDLRFVRFNRAGEELLGHSRNDLLGKSDYDFFPKSQADLFTKKDRNVLNRKEIVDIPEEPIQTRSKGERILHTKKVPILSEKGEAEYLLGISEDITERKGVEKQLLETLENLRKAVGVTIQVMVSAVEVRDPYTAGHQKRSADLARAIAEEMKLPQEKINGIRLAGSIHDIGKLSVPAEILSKPTKLSPIEYSLVKDHARSGYEILKDVESSWPLAEIVYQHHERMDGSGYPRNLKGDEIILEARIMAVADVVEAMASHRPYRPSLGVEAALDEITGNRGSLYDPEVVDACLRLFHEKGYKFE